MIKNIGEKGLIKAVNGAGWWSYILVKIIIHQS